MSIYKRYSDKTKCMYFMIKHEKYFGYENLGKSQQYQKYFNSEVIYIKFFLMAEKRFNTKESFQSLYAPVILIDSLVWNLKVPFSKI